jgi:beta-lactamase regulating signal transducer with metallopeptidase domain
MELMQYILISTACLSVSFITYRLFLRKDYNFHYLRMFLTGSLLLSLVLPLMSVRIDYSELFRHASAVNNGYLIVHTVGNTVVASKSEEGFFSANMSLFIWIYLAVSFLLTARILIQLINLLRLFLISEKRRSNKNIILTSAAIKSPFSFFHLIFVPKDISETAEAEGIIAHENIHASQYHSLDNLLIELISAVMWFNPIVWRMKSSLHLVHEYLADEGALDTGIDRLRYQTPLLNHVSEESLVCLSSGLNHSLIKKRMIMMTKSKNNQGKKLKILTLVPLSAVLLLAVALLNGMFPQQAKAEKPDIAFNTPLNIAAAPSFTAPGDTIKKQVIIIKSTCETKGDRKSEKKCEKKCEKKQIEFTGKTITTSFGGDSLVNVIEVGDNGNVKNLDPEEIETITVKGNDTIIIKCKNIKKCKEAGKGETKKCVIKTEGKNTDDHLLILLDGKEISKEEMDKIDPNTIATIDVTKGGEEIKKMGYNDNYDGVIKIVTKK